MGLGQRIRSELLTSGAEEFWDGYNKACGRGFGVELRTVAFAGARFQDCIAVSAPAGQVRAR